jgi:hypothetical protein
MSAEVDAANARALKAEAKAAALGLGVKPSVADYVAELAITRAVGKITVEQAAAQVVSDLPELKAAPPITTGTKTTGDTLEDENKTRAVMGLQPLTN